MFLEEVVESSRQNGGPDGAARHRQRLPHGGGALVPRQVALVVRGDQDVRTAVLWRLQPHHPRPRPRVSLQNQLPEARDGGADPQHLLALLLGHRPLAAQTLEDRAGQAPLRGATHAVVDPVQVQACGLQGVLHLHVDLVVVAAGGGVAPWRHQAEGDRVVGLCPVGFPRVPGVSVCVC